MNDFGALQKPFELISFSLGDTGLVGMVVKVIAKPKYREPGASEGEEVEAPKKPWGKRKK